MRDERHGEAEMKAGGIAHRRIARGEVGVNGERRLHVGKGRDNDPPNALGGIERQDTPVAVDEAAHHLRLAGGAEC
jgi:hypothetical protein